MDRARAIHHRPRHRARVGGRRRRRRIGGERSRDVTHHSIASGGRRPSSKRVPRESTQRAHDRGRARSPRRDVPTGRDRPSSRSSSTRASSHSCGETVSDTVQSCRVGGNFFDWNVDGKCIGNFGESGVASQSGGGRADARRDGRRRASVVACLSSRVTRARVVTDCVLEVGATRYEMAILSMRDECIFSNFIN